MKKLAAIIGLSLCLQAAVLTAQAVSFAKPITADQGGAYLYSISAGDINGDGILDLAVASPVTGNASYSFGKGDGLFPTWDYALSTSKPAFVLLADVNGDGNLDLLTSDGNYGSLNVDFGDGHGTFPSSSTLNTVYFDGPFAVADLNRDGIADIVGVYGSGGTGYPGGVTVLLGQGNGNFRPEVHFSSGGLNPTPSPSEI